MAGIGLYIVAGILKEWESRTTILSGSHVTRGGDLPCKDLVVAATAGTWLVGGENWSVAQWLEQQFDRL